MASEKNQKPTLYKGVMVSSTFTDLKDHRKALIKAIDGQELKSVVMENDSAKSDLDIIDSSLEMVLNGSAYVGVIGHKYGQIPESTERNPKGLSLTELEYDKAINLKRPVLIFIMGEDHPVKRADVETDPSKIEKLEAFRKKVKQFGPDTSVHRVYATFETLELFATQAIQSIANLRRHLDAKQQEYIELPSKAISTGKDEKISILFLAADPNDQTHLMLMKEFREIQEKLKLAKQRELFQLELPQLSLRPADISQALLDFQPQIVHFSGHGVPTGELCFENQAGESQLVQPNALAALFEQFTSHVNCVLLNACYSELQAKAISKHIKYVIGMNDAIDDNVAIAFSVGFYQGLGAGQSIEDAYNLGCAHIQFHSIPDHLIPVLIIDQQKPYRQSPKFPNIPDLIPTPPALYAEPAYIGSHEFVGRQAQLEILKDWASPADSHSVLLFEAIGGAGKSILTWEWVNNHARNAQDWTGVFWYSFYERDGDMADFCRHALAYITGEPLESFQKKKTAELSDLLLTHLRAKPFLIVFDGIERVLVAYHRLDAAQLADEEAGLTDEIAERDPCAAIRPEDDELLLNLTAASPSKLLITSRLIPRVLLNQASQTIPGVQRVSLPGLHPSDAEQLLRSCGISGDSKAIQDYLKTHCDCHPLVIGVLAGLINNYMADRGNFDAWAKDPNEGSQLELTDLNLEQKRKHILTAAIAALPKESRQLLSTLALISESVDYPILIALNPHLPPKPEQVKKPTKPVDSYLWKNMDDNGKKLAEKNYIASMTLWDNYQKAIKDRLASSAYHSAPQKLALTIKDLEDRSLLQYDQQSKRYDLHPVVRGIAVGGLAQKEKEQYGQSVVDHFSKQTHMPYQEAQSLEDLRDGLHVVRTLLQMGRYQQAFDAYFGDFAIALHINLEAHTETLSLIRRFFPQGWGTLPNLESPMAGGYLANQAGIALSKLGESKAALTAYETVFNVMLETKDWSNTCITLTNISGVLIRDNHMAAAERCTRFALNIATLIDAKGLLFSRRLFFFVQLNRTGQWQEAEAMWQLLDPMGRDWPRNFYRSGDAEYHYARLLFVQEKLTEAPLKKAEQLALAGNNRQVIRCLHGFRGEWQRKQGHHALAAESLREAVRMAHEVGQIDRAAMQAEVLLALAQYHLGELTDHHQVAEHLAKAKQPNHLGLAELWLAIGDHSQAKKHALAAYKWAWADGEPYVNRYELNETCALLKKLDVAIPQLPPYDPSKAEKFPWENDVRAAIEILRKEKEAEEIEDNM